MTLLDTLSKILSSETITYQRDVCDLVIIMMWNEVENEELCLLFSIVFWVKCKNVSYILRNMYKYIICSLNCSYVPYISKTMHTPLRIDID